MIARVGDRTTGTCSAHIVPITTGGTITTGSGTVTCEGPAVARLGDAVELDCGHMSAITSASSSVTADGLGVARIGDEVAQSPYNGTIISAAGVVSAN